MILYIYEEELNALRFVAAALPEGRQIPHPFMVVSEELRDLLVGIWTRSEVVFMWEAPAIAHLWQELGVHFYAPVDVARIFMHLELEGSRLGGLVLRIEKPESYTKESADLLRSVNEPFSIAMSNALRYEEVQTFKEMLAESP